MRVVIIGGGAAGFFTAINMAEKYPDYQVTILEKSSKLLQKVRVSGGGRCNVTNERSAPSTLVSFYPRGQKKLHSVFKKFSTNHMIDWLQQHGVETHAEADKRVFPASNSSQTIIDCFLQLASKYGIEILKNHALEKLEQKETYWNIHTQQRILQADKVVVATGSSQATWNVLSKAGLSISQVVPSLFTFNIKDSRIDGLPGISFDHALVKVAGTKLADEGPLLITHWGLSGPAILKLSAWGAYTLKDKDYQFEILINYPGIATDQARNLLQNYRLQHPKRKVISYPLFDLPKRFWEQIVHHCIPSEDLTYGYLSKKAINKLLEELTQGRYQVRGKSTFKEEFVTAGGVNLAEIDLETFEAKRFPGLYLAGEVLNIDALTGGFNFQACWSAGWTISENMR